MGARKHLATRWHFSGYAAGSILRCGCGQWESNPKETVRAQRDAHRAHRVEMGEEVAPRKPTREERLKAAGEAVARVRALAEQARPALGAACTCQRCESDDGDSCDAPPRWLAWDLDPAAVLAALNATEEDL